ncbi:MAG: cyclodeaminase [Gammaproteobacteria bacterium]|nr:cyclodeaminase [Gammaproteobacteria bacterium]
MSVRVVAEQDLRACVGIDDAALDAVEQAFGWLAAELVEMPPIMHISVADRGGDVDIKSAYVRGLSDFAVKIASGFFDNPKRGLPSSSGMMVVMSAETGFCKAVLLDNGYLTDLRTGLAGAVAARYLAPKRVGTVGVIGTGAQARYQIRSLVLVREFGRLLVFGRDRDRRAAYVEEMRNELGIEVSVCGDPETLVRSADLLVTTTPSTQPLVRADWLRPGQHVTAMGSDLPGKQELEAAALLRADLLVCDRRAQCATMGELQHAIGAGLMEESAEIVELGAVTSGACAGRTSEDQITICDLTGTGVQDTAIASLALERAIERGLGTETGG